MATARYTPTAITSSQSTKDVIGAYSQGGGKKRIADHGEALEGGMQVATFRLLPVKLPFADGPGP